MNSSLSFEQAKTLLFQRDTPGFERYLHSCPSLWVEADHSGYTLLHFACYLGVPESVLLLYHMGASPLTPDLEGFSPLQLASDRGQADCLSVLLWAGFQYDPETAPPKALTARGPLSEAIKAGHLECASLLLSMGFKGSNIDTQIDYPWSELFRFSRHPHWGREAKIQHLPPSLLDEAFEPHLQQKAQCAQKNGTPKAAVMIGKTTLLPFLAQLYSQSDPQTLHPTLLHWSLTKGFDPFGLLWSEDSLTSSSSVSNVTLITHPQLNALGQPPMSNKSQNARPGAHLQETSLSSPCCTYTNDLLDRPASATIRHQPLTHGSFDASSFSPLSPSSSIKTAIELLRGSPHLLAKNVDLEGITPPLFTEFAKLFLHHGLFIDHTHWSGPGLIFLAAMYSNAGAIHWLHQQGVPLDYLNKEGQSALWASCRDGRESIVMLLLSLGAEANFNCQLIATEKKHFAIAAHLEAQSLWDATDGLVSELEPQLSPHSASNHSTQNPTHHLTHIGPGLNHQGRHLDDTSKEDEGTDSGQGGQSSGSGTIASRSPRRL